MCDIETVHHSSYACQTSLMTVAFLLCLPPSQCVMVILRRLADKVEKQASYFLLVREDNLGFRHNVVIGKG